MSTATFRKRSRTFTATVDVEIDIADMVDCGWHSEDDCPANNLPAGYTTLLDALDVLHQEAHGRLPLAMCRKGPCSSLSFEQLRGAA